MKLRRFRYVKSKWGMPVWHDQTSDSYGYDWLPKGETFLVINEDVIRTPTWSKNESSIAAVILTTHGTRTLHRSAILRHSYPVPGTEEE